MKDASKSKYKGHKGPSSRSGTATDSSEDSDNSQDRRRLAVVEAEAAELNRRILRKRQAQRAPEMPPEPFFQILE